ncbi:MAG: NACHT domain-containing protein [Candidatus Electrothrix sp. AS4_5]|nr:NACHT domain-containing protein [Candidatus Electrothrix gigas]
MDLLNEIITGLRVAMDKPDVAWSGLGTYVVSVLLGLAGAGSLWLLARFFKKKTSSDQQKTDDWFSRNRDKLLERLKRDLNDRRKSFLLGQNTLDLEKELSPGAVDRPYSRQDSIEYTLERNGVEVESTDQPITDLFQQPEVGQRLVILGKPGSGKTMCLLKLVELLLKQAEDNTRQPLPIIFECSEWDGRELLPWMAWQLNRKYDIQEKIARQMVEERDILPLFDGLDELAAEKQGDFIRLFNTLPNDRPQVVCCRVKEYGQLQENSGVKLALKNAVILRDISRPRLKGHLLRQGLDELWNMLEQSENEVDSSLSPTAEGELQGEQSQSLLELARRPLFLGIMIGVSEKLRKGFKRRQGESWEDLLWRLYLNDCLAPRTPPPNEPPDEHDREYAQAPSRHWLHCLARWMQVEDKVALHLDELQPSMLKEYWRFGLLYGLFYGLTWGLVIGFIIGPISGTALGLAMGLLFGLPGCLPWKWVIKIVSGLAWGWVGWLTRGPEWGIFIGLVFMLLVENEQQKIESLRPLRLPRFRQDWWTFTEQLLTFLAVGLGAGLLCGLVLGLVQAQGIGLKPWLAFIPAFGSAVGLTAGLAVGLNKVVGPFKRTSQPQQRLKEALRSSLFLFPLFLLAGMLAFVQIIFLAEQWGIGTLLNITNFYLALFGLAFVSFVALGTGTVLMYYLLRLCLRWEGQLPLRLIPWLNVMHQRKVFQRVGGSYHFLHKQLRDYLAKQQSTRFDQKEKTGS